MKTNFILAAFCWAVLFGFAGLPLAGQTRPFVRAVGQGSVSIKPDQAKVSFSVITQASTAQAASTQNATQVQALLTALTGVLGPNADVRTVSYSLSPNYTYPQNQQPVLTGYTASNTVQATTTDLANVGKLIDTGIQAGANQVQGLSFGLINDQDARSQALKLATMQAKALADAMASGLGMHTGAAQTIQEGVATSTTPVSAVGAVSATPVVSGTLTIDATVTLDVSLVP
jgi:uncharacterized protein YggE